MHKFFRNNNISYIVIKLINLGYIEIIAFLLGIFLADMTDRLFGKLNEEEENKKSIIIVILELFMYLWFIGIVIYLVHQLIIIIPSPFDNLYGFKHSELYELKDAPIFIIIYLYFQKFYKEKLTYTYTRVSNLF